MYIYASYAHAFTRMYSAKESDRVNYSLTYFQRDWADSFVFENLMWIQAKYIKYEL